VSTEGGAVSTEGGATGTEVLDRFAAARAVADAVLYEGYLLYPYRASSRKNQVRWQFGVLTPRTFSEADGSERWSMRTECLVAPRRAADPTVAADPTIAVRIRCLQLQRRVVQAPSADGGFEPVHELEVDGNVHLDWDEAIDRTLDLPPFALSSLVKAEHKESFLFEEGIETEPILAADGAVAGRLVRTSEQVHGRARVTAAALEPALEPAAAPAVALGLGPGSPVAGEARQLFKLSVTVENCTRWTGTGTRRDDVLGHCLIAVHTMLAVDDGAFVSLIDPPDDARQAAATCRSEGAFPVLIGGDDLVLSSPIILYDQPEIAAESPGDLYDATEIDEILALRVMTLTDEEKSEARATDPRAAAIIDRCDEMPPELWDRLHGAVRSLRPAAASAFDLDPLWEPGQDLELPSYGPGGSQAPWWDPAVDASVDPWSDSVIVAGVEVAKGSAVRLRPSHRADAQDLFLHGLPATVAGVFKDVDGSEHVAVTIDSDPATAELSWQGRFLFFHPDEVEPLPGGPGGPGAR
jgi:hypothetical protein